MNFEVIVRESFNETLGRLGRDYSAAMTARKEAIRRLNDLRKETVAADVHAEVQQREERRALEAIIEACTGEETS